MGAETRAADQVSTLSVSFDRPHLVFDPDETFRVSVGLNLIETYDTPEKPGKAMLKWKLQSAEKNKTVAEGSMSVVATMNSPSPALVPIDLRMPHEEGVYNLRLSLSGHGFDDVDRVVQLIVIDPMPVKLTAAADRSERLVDSFEPESAGPFRKVSLNSLRHRHDHTLPRFLTLKRSRDGFDREVNEPSDVHHVAYKLHVAHPGNPHRLEIKFSAGVDQTAVVGIFQRDAHGKLDRAGPDGWLSLAAPPAVTNLQSAGSSEQIRVYRQIFWPQVDDPAIVISSQRSGQIADQPIVPVSVLLYELSETLAAGSPATNTPYDSQTAPRKRMVGNYLHTPDLPENFGVSRYYDAAVGAHLDDWQTFLLAGRRLTEFLQYQQQSALMLGVFAEGATIYPSRLIDSSLRYDRGRLASNGQDPIQKDVLELILRMFDRAGLALVPELQFDAQLPAIERLLGEYSDTASDLQLVDGEGRPRAQAHDISAASTPGYNVLSPRVQTAVLDVVGELLDRYKRHPSLAGVAIELSPQSFVQLPDLEWGYDRETIRRFEKAARIQVPHSAGNDWRPEAYRFLTTTARRDWVRFRCAEVARFHRKLSELVTAAIPDGRVIFSGRLAPLRVVDSPDAVLDVVRTSANPTQMLQSQGLNFSQPPYATDAKVLVLRPILLNTGADKASLAALTTFDDSPVIDALYRSVNHGGLLQSVSIGMDSLPRERGLSHEEFNGQPVSRIPHSGAVRRRYAHLLATLDAQVIFDGGETISLATDESIRRLRQTIGSLPDVPFHFAGPQVQPVVVRAAHQGRATYLYAVNDSALTLKFELVLDCPSTTTCRSLESGKLLVLEPGPDERKSRLPVETAGHGVFACRLEQAGAKVSEMKLTISDEVLAFVQHRIDSLSVKIAPAINLIGAETPSSSSAGRTADEVRQLTKTLASVKLAWEEGRYADCQRLLDGYWGQLLLAEPVAPPAVSPARTRIGDRMRNVLRR